MHSLEWRTPHNVPLNQTASRTHLTRTLAVTLAITRNNLNAKSCSIHSSNNSCLPISISNSIGEGRWQGVVISYIAKPSFSCIIACDTTEPNRHQVQSRSRMSGCDGKTLPRRPGETGFGAHHPLSPFMNCIWQHTVCPGTYQLWCNKHLYISGSTPQSLTATHTSSYLHPAFQWPGDDVCQEESKCKSLGSRFWAP